MLRGKEDRITAMRTARLAPEATKYDLRWLV